MSEFIQIFRLTTAIGETMFTIPYINNAVFHEVFWIGLLSLLTLHIASFLFSYIEERDSLASTAGIFGCIFTLIPYLSTMMHFFAAVLLWRAWVRND